MPGPGRRLSNGPPARRPPRSLRRGVRGLLAVVGIGAVTACGGDGGGGAPTGPTIPTTPTRPTLDPTYRPSGHAADGAVFVHLFEWPWEDIARECETVLGPAGWAAVQLSPPQEHAVLEGSGYPWWQRYQPVSYTLESRSGTREQFADMVERCGAAGVDIYVDAVINHMTAGAGVGSAGTPYTKYDYPGLYDASDFHPPCEVTNYQSAANVQDCELLGLADLHTGLPRVRSTIADYLIDLVRLGVDGFRIDAAKHIQPVELDSILDRVDDAVRAEDLPLPYWFAEVIDHGGEAVGARDYFGLAYGSGGAAGITEFRYRAVGERFTASGGPPLSGLEGFSAEDRGLLPGDKAVVFLQNHDTQRQGGIGYRDGDRYRLAHVWMLAWPYGYPKVMSGYGFDRSSPVGRDAGPPSEDGATRPVACVERMEDALIGDWTCEHRDAVIAAMVGFRRRVAGEPVTDWWDDGDAAIAFSRGAQGFVAINAGETTADVATASGLPAGRYCDLLTGTAADACAGRVIAVDSVGAVAFELPARTAVALHVDTRP